MNVIIFIVVVIVFSVAFYFFYKSKLSTNNKVTTQEDTKEEIKHPQTQKILNYINENMKTIEKEEFKNIEPMENTSRFQINSIREEGGITYADGLEWKINGERVPMTKMLTEDEKLDYLENQKRLERQEIETNRIRGLIFQNKKNLYNKTMNIIPESDKSKFANCPPSDWLDLIFTNSLKCYIINFEGDKDTLTALVLIFLYLTNFRPEGWDYLKEHFFDYNKETGLLHFKSSKIISEFLNYEQYKQDDDTYILTLDNFTDLILETKNTIPKEYCEYCVSVKVKSDRLFDINQENTVRIKQNLEKVEKEIN